MFGLDDTKAYPIWGKFALLFYLIIFLCPPIYLVFLLIQFVAERIYNPDVKHLVYKNEINWDMHPDNFNHDTTGYLKGDGSKFVGMMYVSRTEEAWANVKKFWDTVNKTFFRHDEPETSFSGDMLIGQITAITIRRKENKLTDEEKSFLGDVPWRMMFESLIPFKFAGERGKIWAFYSFVMNNVFNILIMLKWGYEYNVTWYKRWLMRALYWVFFAIHIPFFLIGKYGHNMWVKRTHFVWTYCEHSDALTYAMAVLENIGFAKKGLESMNEKHGFYNADIGALAYALLNDESRYESTYQILSAQEETKRAGSTNVSPESIGYEIVEYRKGNRFYKGFGQFFVDWWSAIKKDWKQVWNFPLNESIVDYMLINEMISDTYLGGYTIADYTWERNLQHPGGNNAEGDLDMLFALHVMHGALKFDNK